MQLLSSHCYIIFFSRFIQGHCGLYLWPLKTDHSLMRAAISSGGPGARHNPSNSTTVSSSKFIQTIWGQYKKFMLSGVYTFITRRQEQSLCWQEYYSEESMLTLKKTTLSAWSLAWLIKTLSRLLWNSYLNLWMTVLLQSFWLKLDAR